MSASTRKLKQILSKQRTLSRNSDTGEKEPQSHKIRCSPERYKCRNTSEHFRKKKENSVISLPENPLECFLVSAFFFWKPKWNEHSEVKITKHYTWRQRLFTFSPNLIVLEKKKNPKTEKNPKKTKYMNSQSAKNVSSPEYETLSLCKVPKRVSGLEFLPASFWIAHFSGFFKRGRETDILTVYSVHKEGKHKHDFYKYQPRTDGWV